MDSHIGVRQFAYKAMIVAVHKSSSKTGWLFDRYFLDIQNDIDVREIRLKMFADINAIKPYDAAEAECSGSIKKIRESHG